MTYYIVAEALNYECCAIAQMMGISHLSTEAILLGGKEEQKKRFLGRMTESYRSGCYCFTGREAGTDNAVMRTTAKKVGDKYVTNGSKCYISNGQYADLLCLFTTIHRSLGNKGICCFVVPRDTPGISVGRIEDKMGHRALNVAELFFEEMELSSENLIGKEEEGFKLAMMALDRGRVNITAICMGIAQKAFDEALGWARQHEQFG